MKPGPASPNDEARMTKHEGHFGQSNGPAAHLSDLGIRHLGIRHSFDIRASVFVIRGLRRTVAHTRR
jgi:hypothetical protein